MCGAEEKCGVESYTKYFRGSVEGDGGVVAVDVWVVVGLVRIRRKKGEWNISGDMATFLLTAVGECKSRGKVGKEETLQGVLTAVLRSKMGW